MINGILGAGAAAGHGDQVVPELHTRVIGRLVIAVGGTGGRKGVIGGDGVEIIPAVVAAAINAVMGADAFEGVHDDIGEHILVTRGSGGCIIDPVENAAGRRGVAERIV